MIIKTVSYSCMILFCFNMRYSVHVLHTHRAFHTFLALVLHLFLLHWKGDLEHLQLNLSKSQIGFLMWCTASCRDRTKQKHIILKHITLFQYRFVREPIKIYFLIWNYWYSRLLRECFGNPWEINHGTLAIIFWFWFKFTNVIQYYVSKIEPKSGYYCESAMTDLLLTIQSQVVISILQAWWRLAWAQKHNIMQLYFFYLLVF